MFMFMTRVLGVDPGTIITGFGVVERRDNSLVCVDSGEARLSKGKLLSNRLQSVYAGISEIIVRTRPEALVVENIFYGKNPRSLIKQGEMRGVIILAGAKQGIPIYEYSPLEIKRAVVGYGRAEKSQVQMMVKAILNLAETPPADVADALAAAICHLNHLKEQTI